VDEDVVDYLPYAMAQDVGRLLITDPESVHDVCRGDLDLSAHPNLANGNKSPLWLVTFELLAHLKTNRLEKVHALEELIALRQNDAAATLIPTPIVVQVS